MNMDAVQCSTSPSRDSPSPTPSEEKRAASASSSATKPEDEAKVVYKKRLASALLGDEDGARHKILKFTAKPAVPPPESFQSSLHARFSHNKLSSIPSANARKLNRHVPSAPKKVLDAPELMNDYYLNLLSWGQNNILAVALGQSVYLWNEQTGKIDELMVLDGSTYVSSVNWSDANGSSYLAVGTSDSVVQLWDVAAFKQVRSMNGHSSRVGALSWNNYIVSSGSRDSTIVHHDVRARAHNIATLAGHRQEVCGLSWSPDGTTLASGGNDNKLCLWKASSTIGSSARTHSPTFCLEQHSAAVKAIAWCPWERNLLATGGGTADRTIKFWNTSNGALLNSVDTGSQVCSLLWSHSEKELLSSHGYSQNELCLWKYPSMTKVKELTGHTSRVLHLAASPDGSTVVSGAADETLRFWEVFGPNRKAGKAGSAATELTTSTLSNVMSIR
jgi:cell division cycle 20, cofactor of APC complex